MTRVIKTIVRVSLIILLAFVACLIFPRRTAEAEQAPKPASSPAVRKPSGSPSSAIQRLRNIGKAYYEQGKYAEAIEEFQKVLASEEALATDHLNLGLALMQAHKLDEALGALTTAKQMDPKLVAADYNLGILFKRELRYPESEAAQKRVIEADPDEPAAWFNLGTVYFAQRKLDEALDAHRHVVEMGFGRGQNFYVASLFHTFTALVRLGRKEEAQKYLRIHEKMRDAVPGISLQNPALEGGKYGAILVPSTPAVRVARRKTPEKVIFADITARLGIKPERPALPSPHIPDPEIKAEDYSLEFARQQLVPQFGPRLALGDYNNDGQPDLYIVDPAGRNRLLKNNGNGSFSDVTETTRVAGPGGSLTAFFADHNNSGHPSLFVAGLGGIRVYRNTGEGTFEEETEKSGLKNQAGELITQALLFDGDNDGYLDLLATAYADLGSPPSQPSFAFPKDFSGGRTRFYRNNADGTFSDMTDPSGFGAVKGRVRGATIGDFDDDGYTDVVVLREDDSPLLFLGRGECKFANRTAEAGSVFNQASALDAQVADFNHDGDFDLALWSPSGYQVLLNRGGGRFRAATRLPAIIPPAGLFAFRGTVADVNGDTFDDLLAVDADGRWHLLTNSVGRFQEAGLSLPLGSGQPVTSLLATWLSTPGKLNLLALTSSRHLAAFEKEGPASRWLEVKMNGFKSNTMGIGSIVELKAGNFYNKLIVNGDRVRVYTGDLAKLDVVRVTWPNAVVQNWVNVATNRPVEVRESERLASSCPFVYIWDGERFVFLTDVLGVGPLGEFAPDGGRLRPYFEEFVRLPGSMRPRNGKYVFQFTDELREVDYFDQVRLFAVDHPETEEVYANEIYSSAPSSPTIHAVRSKHFPVSAVDHEGNDVLPLLLKADDRYPTNFRRHRIPGVADLHSITLDPGAMPPSAPLTLWLRGWVYWTDSNNHRALMSNSAVQLVPPYVQVRDERGAWVTVIPDMGLPSGTNRTMRVDLTDEFLSSDRRVRIVTNMLVYWDQAFFSLDEAVVPTSLEVPLLAADLHYRGFSTPITDSGGSKPEHFEYASLLPEAPWNPMIGNYTRYGDVVELVTAADDRMVVMATGDELSVEFDGSNLPPVKPGWKRTFFLYTHGWAKDGEPNTAYSKTVEPLPFKGMSNYPYSPEEQYPDTEEHRRYLEDYQTRPRYLLIPPLAPLAAAAP